MAEAAVPVVSVLMTAFNAAPWIGDAVESVLTQTDCPWFDLVLVDDGSTDGTRQKCEAMAALHNRIRFYAFATNQGRGRALQKAHGMARGELVGWVDADDILMPGAIAATAEKMLARPDAGQCYTRHWLMSADGKRQEPGRRSDSEFEMRHIRSGHIAHHFRLMRASFVEAVGGVADWPASVDYDLSLRLAEIAPTLQVPRRLYKYRTRPGSISKSLRAEQRAFGDLARARAAALRERLEGDK